MLLSHIYKYIVLIDLQSKEQNCKFEIQASYCYIKNLLSWTFLTGNYMFKVNNRNTRKRCDDASGAVLVSLLLTLNIFHTLF